MSHHDPEVLLSAIGVSPGGSLIGFDAALARRILENLDWIEGAKVQRRFPNQLDIAVRERDPFAIWQRGAAYYVIDKTGAAMSGLAASQLVKLPLVTGEGANLAAAELIYQLEAYPDLMLQVKAAARVGGRRWTARHPWRRHRHNPCHNGSRQICAGRQWRCAAQPRQSR